MKIVLSDTWSIEGIPLNYVLKHKRLSSGTGKNKGTTRMIEVDEGYYCRVEDALYGYAAKAAKDQTEDFNGDIKDYCNRINNIMDTAVEKMKARVKEWEKDT